MSRSFLALGLVAASLVLLSALFADMQEQVRGPDGFTPDEDTLQHGADAASKLDPDTLAALAEGAQASGMQIPEGTQLTLPEGTTIDGDQITLNEDLEVVLPARTTLEDVAIPLEEGTTVFLPDGTKVDGNALVFPPGSSIILQDGTELLMPDGGRLVLPGMTEAQLQQAAADGIVKTPADSVFFAPMIQPSQPWPVTLPAGTTFTAPAGWSVPDGTLDQDTPITIPEGTDVDFTAARGSDAAHDGASFFSQIAGMVRPPGAPDAGNGAGTGANGADGGGFSAPAIPGGWLWLWIPLGIAALIGAWWLWRRYGDVPTTTNATGAARATRLPIRARYVVPGRPADLPLAAAPGQSLAVRIAIEARNPIKSTGQGPASARRWHQTQADVDVRLDGRSLGRFQLGTEGELVNLGALPAGDHELELRVRAGARPKAFTLHETVRIAPWEQQIARDYQRLYDAAHAHGADLEAECTPRELEAHVRSRVVDIDHAASDAAITIFEKANYGPRTVQDADWIQFATFAEATQRALGAKAPRAMPPASGNTASA